MQPHSTCAIALANYIYNYYHRPHKARGTIRIEYQNRWGEYKNLIYSFQDLQSRGENYRRGFSVWVKKSGDPLSCILTVHTTDGEYYQGKHFYITHGTQHIAGLEEHFDLYRNGIKNGYHRNSMKYDDYSGSFLQDDYSILDTYLRKTKTHEKKQITFRIKIESMHLQFLPSNKSTLVEDQHQREENIEEVNESQSFTMETQESESEQSSSIINWRDIMIFGVIGVVVLGGIILFGLANILRVFR